MKHTAFNRFTGVTHTTTDTETIVPAPRPVEYRISCLGAYWPVAIQARIRGRWRLECTVSTVSEAEEWIVAQGGTIRDARRG